MLKPGGRIRIALLLAIYTVATNLVLAQATLDPRLQISVSLLPGIIAANKTQAAHSEIDHIPIYLVYQDDEANAELLQLALESIGSIRNRKLQISLVRLDELSGLVPSRTSVIFISEPLEAQLADIVDYSDKHNVLVFSPFKGDVELGITTGLQVTDKVLPAVNMKSLQNAQIELKAFFLRIAVKYD